MKILIKILRIFTKRAFLGSLLFAIALWGYTSLNSNYSTYVDVPLTVKLPPTRAIERELPTTIAIESRGTGWNLFNLIYMNNSKRVNVDLSNTQIEDSVFIIGRSDFVKGLESFEKVEFAEVIPEILSLQTGKIGAYKVPVLSLIEITPREGFSLVGDIQLKPDSITVLGNNKITSKIKSWSTQKLIIENANKPIRGIVELSDSLGEIVEFDTPQIQFYSNIQLTLEKTFYDIPIVIRGGAMPRNSRIYPEKLDITVRGGIDVVKNMNKDDLVIALDYSSIANDKTGILVPKIESPSEVQVIQINPAYVYHKVFLKQTGLLKVN